jgi:hypothetical protein
MFNWYTKTKKKTSSEKEKVMSYNEYCVEYQTNDFDKVVTNFSFIEAKSPEEAGEKMTNLTDNWIKIIEVKICDHKYWSLG